MSNSDLFSYLLSLYFHEFIFQKWNVFIDYFCLEKKKKTKLSNQNTLLLFKHINRECSARWKTQPKFKRATSPEFKQQYKIKQSYFENLKHILNPGIAYLLVILVGIHIYIQNTDSMNQEQAHTV